MIDKVNVPMIDELDFPEAQDCTEDGLLLLEAGMK